MKLERDGAVLPSSPGGIGIKKLNKKGETKSNPRTMGIAKRPNHFRFMGLTFLNKICNLSFGGILF
jgi:hypothetical protein